MSSLRRRIRSRLARWWVGLQIALTVRIVDLLLRGVAATSRTIEIRPEYDLDRRGEVSVVLTLHQGLLYLMHHFRNRGGMVMASRSRDGDIVTAGLRRLGYHVARGSDKHGGVHALDEMIEFVRKGQGSAALTCDGPRGPYGAVKLGVLKLARETGRPLVPCAVWVSRHKLLSNWDRTIVPLPFSRIVICYGKPLWIAPGTEWKEVRRIRDELVREMAGLVAEARAVAEGSARDLHDSGPAPSVHAG